MLISQSDYLGISFCLSKLMIRLYIFLLFLACLSFLLRNEMFHLTIPAAKRDSQSAPNDHPSEQQTDYLPPPVQLQISIVQPTQTRN